jgi:citronellyl-CoA synthetase
MSTPDSQLSFSEIATRTASLIPRLPGFVKSARLMRKEHSDSPVGIGPCIEEIAEKSPKQTAILFDDRSVSYEDFNAWSNRIANFFLKKGFKKGDVVGVFVPNSPELLAAITGLNKIGVIAALVNTSQRQKVLHHSFEMVSPKANIIGEDLIEAFNEIKEELSCKENFFWSDCDTLLKSNDTPASYGNFEQAIRSCSSANPKETQNSMPQDINFYIYTSGTTGLPKAVEFTNARWLKAYAGFGYTALCLNKNDVMYVTLPFYHATALVICWGSVLAGHATLAMRKSFSASEFWSDIRKYNATSFGYVGELCRYLMNQEPSAKDKKHQIKKIVGNGLRPNIWGDFKLRFGIENVFELYASSEGNVGMLNLLNIDNTVGICLFPYAIVKYDQDKQEPVRSSKGRFIPVKKGEPGLLITKITRITQPASYTDPEKTKQLILRDVFIEGDKWFNTGDMMRDIGFRHMQFVDRLGDTFRWKGENVSTTELENVISKFKGISEAVVYGVEIPGTNGRAGMATLVPEGSASGLEHKLDDLLKELRNNLPSYSVPLFLRIKTDLDITGTFKYKKSDLKKEGYNPDLTEDGLFALLPDEKSYKKIDRVIFNNIVNEQFNF